MTGSSSDAANRLMFVRITLIGGSNSGKTCLVNSFVNGICPSRYTSTDKAVVYYRKVEVEDEGEYNNSLKSVLVEIEDTPGSDRGNDDDDEDDAAGAPQIKKNSRVTVLKDKNEVMAMFDNKKYKKTLHPYRPGMDSMLGKEYSVKLVAKDGTIGLPSPDESEGVMVWYFPPGAIKLKVAMELPIEQYLTLGEKEQKAPSALADKRKLNADLQRPLLAYQRPVGNPDVDKTVTKNRMGYFIAFDISDETGDSLIEAMTCHKMLAKSLATKTQRMKPIIWLVGCKKDKTAVYEAVSQNKESAAAWSQKNLVPYYSTSARNHSNVHHVFNEMIQAISARENLWSLEGLDADEVEGKESQCIFS